MKYIRVWVTYSVDFRDSEIGKDVRITYENAISQATNPTGAFVLGIGPRFSARSHFGINPGRKRRQIADRPNFARDLLYVLRGDTELANSPFALQRRNKFLDHVREGGWFPLSTRMYLWPVEYATPAPKLYQNVNITLFDPLTYADYYGRRFDATLDRAIWPLEYSYHSLGWPLVSKNAIPIKPTLDFRKKFGCFRCSFWWAFSRA